MSVPKQKPGQSKQDYQTPPEFLVALKNRLGIQDFDIDLAASKENAVCLSYYDEEMDSLKQSWVRKGWGFCNPPYANIRPWVKKACDEVQKGAKVAILVPAAVGANWWRDYVDQQASVWFLNGRLTFVGAAGPYPKDCAVLLYGPFHPVYSVWNWRT